MEKTLRIIGIVCACLFVAWLAWYLLCEPNVSNQRERASDVRNELSNTGDAQRDAQSHIDNAGQRIDRSIESVDEIARGIDETTERIADSAERNAECAELISDSERRIEESKRILQAVRTRKGQDGK